jgi:hypothetical protein
VQFKGVYELLVESSEFQAEINLVCNIWHTLFGQYVDVFLWNCLPY